MVSPEIQAKARAVITKAAGKYMVVTAESCTGGLVAASLTEIAGSSNVVDRGFVTYSNAAKTEMLGVPASLIDTHGAVSEPVALAMVAGALQAAPAADIAVSITGIAGPGGGSADKPVGLVHFAVQRRGSPAHHARHIFDGDRHAVRTAALITALDLIESQMDA